MLAAILITLYLWTPGWAWCWCIRPQETERKPNWLYRMAIYGAMSFIFGFLWNACTALALGQLGLYTSQRMHILRLACILTGLALARVRASKQIWPRLQAALPSGAGLILASLIILALPNRGQWIIGGWDPGVYLNQAVALHRTGSFYPSDLFFYQELEPEEQSAFTRTGNGRTERFPAVVINPQRQSFDYEFFRLTPAFFSVFQDAGGIHALTRANTIIGIASLLVLFALTWTAFGGISASVAVILLALQPIWLYHLHWPVTEHLQLFLILSFFLFAIIQPTRYRLRAICLVAAVINRFAFLPFAGILLASQSVAEWNNPKRKKLIQAHVGTIGLLIAAGLINVLIAPTSLRGWTQFPLILTVSAIGFAGTIAVDIVISLLSMRGRLQKLLMRSRYGWVTMLTITVILSWLGRDHIAGPDHIDNLKQLSLFIGSTALMAGTVGNLYLLLKQHTRCHHIIWTTVMPLLLVTWLLVINKSITDLYPWATRRYLPWTALWIALSVPPLIQDLWNAKRLQWLGRICAIMGLATIVTQWLPMSRKAFLYTSYNGAYPSLLSISQSLEPNDVIISDHPRWGTPLALTFGNHVLNGREIWSNNDKRRTNAAIKAIEKLHQKGYRVLLLTSTSTAIAIFPFDQSQWQLLKEFPEYTYQQIIQHPRAAEYVLETTSANFKLYQFIHTGLE